MRLSAHTCMSIYVHTLFLKKSAKMFVIAQKRQTWAVQVVHLCSCMYLLNQ
jgi:hypothetical protein